MNTTLEDTLGIVHIFANQDHAEKVDTVRASTGLNGVDREACRWACHGEADHISPIQGEDCELRTPLDTLPSCGRLVDKYSFYALNDFDFKSAKKD